MKALIFMLAMRLTEMMNYGMITRADENDGRPTYHLTLPDGARYEYVYAEEIVEYMVTGTFEYDEALTLFGNEPTTEPITFDTNN